MRKGGAAFLWAVLFAVIGCGSSPSDGGAGGSPDENPGQSPTSDGGAAAPSFAGDAGGSPAACDGTLDLQGCPCSLGAAARSCYPGAASHAGVGACTLGQQTCAGHGELGGVWGPCVGAGAPRTCATAGVQCGTTDDGCGGSLDCGGCSASDGAAPDASQPEAGVGACGGGGGCAALNALPAQTGEGPFTCQTCTVWDTQYSAPSFHPTLPFTGCVRTITTPVDSERTGCANGEVYPWTINFSCTPVDESLCPNDRR